MWIRFTARTSFPELLDDEDFTGRRPLSWACSLGNKMFWGTISSKSSVLMIAIDLTSLLLVCIFKDAKLRVGSSIEENLEGRKSPIFCAAFRPNVWEERRIRRATDNLFWSIIGSVLCSSNPVEEVLLNELDDPCDNFLCLLGTPNPSGSPSTTSSPSASLSLSSSMDSASSSSPFLGASLTSSASSSIVLYPGLTFGFLGVEFLMCLCSVS